MKHDWMMTFLDYLRWFLLFWLAVAIYTVYAEYKRARDSKRDAAQREQELDEFIRRHFRL